MKKVKILLLVMAVIFAFGILLVGCNNDEAATTTGTKATQKAAATTPAKTPTKAAATTPAKTETPTEAPTADPDKVKFSEDFSKDLSKWEVHGGEWTIVDGAVELAAVGDGPKLMAKDTNFSNFVLEADVTINEIVEGQTVYNTGFVFRTSEPGSGADSYKGYYVGFSLEGAIGGKANAGIWAELGNAPLETPLELGEKVHIKVEVEDELFKLYVDDMSSAIFEFEDTDENSEPFETGMIGMRCWQNGSSFDNITVTVG